MTDEQEKQQKILTQIAEMYPNYQIVVVVYNEDRDIRQFGYGCPKCAFEVLGQLAEYHSNSSHIPSEEKVH